MSAWRRKDETVEAVQFDGSNRSEVRALIGNHMPLTDADVGLWFTRDYGFDGRCWKDDADFRAQFEPVPAEDETASLRAQLAEERAARLRDESEHLGVRHELAEERAALSELSMALGNPCLEFGDEGLSVSLVRHALAQLAEARAAAPRWVKCDERLPADEGPHVVRELDCVLANGEARRYFWMHDEEGTPAFMESGDETAWPQPAYWLEIVYPAEPIPIAPAQAEER